MCVSELRKGGCRLCRYSKWVCLTGYNSISGPFTAVCAVCLRQVLVGHRGRQLSRLRGEPRHCSPGFERRGKVHRGGRLLQAGHGGGAVPGQHRESAGRDKRVPLHVRAGLLRTQWRPVCAVPGGKLLPGWFLYKNLRRRNVIRCGQQRRSNGYFANIGKYWLCSMCSAM